MSVGYVLADSSAFFSEGVVRILGGSQRLRFLGRAATPQAVAQLTLRRQPDVVVAGFEPPATSIGIARGLDVPVVVMTWSWHTDELLAALDAGVRGFLTKDLSPADLEQALLHVAAGGTVTQRPRADSGPERRSGPVGLTPREAEILRLVVAGYSNKRLALALGIAHQTAKNHLHNLMTKIGATTRAELREWAIGNGYQATGPGAAPDAGHRPRPSTAVSRVTS